MKKTYSTTPVFVAACAGMAFFGVTMLSLGPILGQLSSIVEGASSLPSIMSVGIILGTVLFGPVVDRFGYKWLLIISSLLSLAGVQGLANFEELPLLKASIFCLGLGGGILNGETNAIVSDIYDDDKRGGRLAFLGACYCVGALLWTLLNYFITDYKIPLNSVSVVMAAFIVFFVCIAFPKAKPAGNVSVKKAVGMLKYPALILFAIILFFQSGFEGASGSFTVSFLENMAGKESAMTHAAATLAMTWFTIGMLAGRLLLDSIMKKLKNIKTLFMYLLVATAGVVLMLVFHNNVPVVYTALALIGFGVGATYPVILNFIGGAFREMSGTAFSMALFIALLGQYSFNMLVGKAFVAKNYLILPSALLIALGLIMLLVPVAEGFAKKMNK